MGPAKDRWTPADPRPLVLNRPRKQRPVARPADTPGLAARRGALGRLDAVFERGAMLDDGPSGGATGPERAQALSLADLTLRRLGQIDDVLAHFVDRKPKGTGLQILRLMAAELLFEGTPPHAAVDLAVRLAQGGRGTARLSGLINAVGRRLAEQGAELTSGQDAGPMNMRGWLRERLIKDWGRETALGIAKAHLSPAPHDLTMRHPEDLKPLAQETGGTILPTGSLRLAGRPQISALPGYEQGAWWVQDAAAALPARLISSPEGKRVLDLCAAPGGKTMQLAAMGAEVTALDISDGRLMRLRENLKRTGLDARIVNTDALEWQPDQPFDAILLDAPCSATGTIRRHPDLPYRSSAKGLKSLTELQSRLLNRAASWVAPGGTLIFCTCSLFPAEGELQTKAFLERQADFRRQPIGTDEIPPELVNRAGDMRTRPDHWADQGGLDGFFATRLVRAR